MAGLDWASLANNFSREVTVLFTEMPEAFDVMDQIRAAGECSLESAKEAAEKIQESADEAAAEAKKAGEDAADQGAKVAKEKASEKDADSLGDFDADTSSAEDAADKADATAKEL